MATLDPNFTLELTTIKLVAGAAIDYSSMPINPALPDASQLQVRWNVTTVYQGARQGDVPPGTAVTVSTLSQTLQDEIQTLLSTMYTVDAVAKTVTVNAASTIEDQITFGNYYFPSAFNVGSSQPIVIRRDTNVTNASVVFSPGSRLTSELLNTSDAQMLNAIQEIVAFGDGNSSGGGSGGTIDLDTYSIFDLGDVSASSGSGLLSYDTGTGLVTTGGAGSLVPAGGGTHEYLRKSSNIDGVVEWYDLSVDINGINTDIASNSSAITTLQDKTQNQTATTSATNFSLDVNIGGNLVCGSATTVNALTSINDVNAGTSISAGTNVFAVASVYAGDPAGNGQARLWHSSGRLNVYGEENSGLYVGSTSPNTLGAARVVATSTDFYVEGNNTGTTTNYDYKKVRKLQLTAYGLYYYNNLAETPSGSSLTTIPGKTPFQARSKGYTHTMSAFDPTGSSNNYVISNPQGAHRQFTGNGGSTWVQQNVVDGKARAKFGNRGQIYLNPNGAGRSSTTTIHDEIMLRPQQIGVSGGSVVSGIYDDSRWNGSNSGLWIFSCDGLGVCRSLGGWHQASDETLKEYVTGGTIPSGVDNRGATAKLAALTIQAYKYVEDTAGTGVGEVSYGFKGSELAADADFVNYGIVRTAPTIPDSTDVGVIPGVSDDPDVNPADVQDDTIIPGQVGGYATIDLLSLSAVTVQSVGDLDTRTSALEAAPSSGIQSNIGTGGSGSGAIANMVTISTGAYSTLGTPDPTTVYFLT